MWGNVQASTIFVRYAAEGDDFLNQIVIEDETWMAYVTLVPKQQSMEWRHATSPNKVRFKQTISIRKIICTYRVLGQETSIACHLFPRIETIDSENQFESLRRLRRGIPNKRRGMLRRGIILLHDNAQLYTTVRTEGLIASFDWKQLDYAPYSVFSYHLCNNTHLFYIRTSLSSKQGFGEDWRLIMNERDLIRFTP